MDAGTSRFPAIEAFFSATIALNDGILPWREISLKRALIDRCFLPVGSSAAAYACLSTPPVC
jgi:hypothetical protein